MTEDSIEVDTSSMADTEVQDIMVANVITSQLGREHSRHCKHNVR